MESRSFRSSFRNPRGIRSSAANRFVFDLVGSLTRLLVADLDPEVAVYVERLLVVQQQMAEPVRHGEVLADLRMVDVNADYRLVLIPVQKSGQVSFERLKEDARPLRPRDPLNRRRSFGHAALGEQGAHDRLNSLPSD